MNNLDLIRKISSPYIYSEVSVGNEKYLIPFDCNCVPMTYEELKGISENLNNFLKKISREDYEMFYKKIVENITTQNTQSSEEYDKKRYEEKKKKEKEYFEKFDYNISKEILQEKEIENILKNLPLYPSDFADTREIKYPVIVNFYKDEILIKTVTCSKNLIQTLANVKNKYDYDSYSYSYIPEEYIGQVLEYIVLFKKPVHTSSMSLRNYVVYCPLNILIKRLNKDGDYMFARNRLLKLLDKNKVQYFEREGRIIVNARETLHHVGNFLSGIEY